MRVAQKVDMTEENKMVWRKVMHVFKLVVCMAVMAAAVFGVGRE